MDSTPENPVQSGAEGARRQIAVNLSGKRTEFVFLSRLGKIYGFVGGVDTPSFFVERETVFHKGGL